MFAALLLVGLFSKEILDDDFWWHLKTGQYIWQTRSLPSPDPFAYTTAAAKNTYPGEETTRKFNLTHEWLAQLLMYLTWRVIGFGGIVLVRAALLACFCLGAGALAYLRCGGFYRALGAMFAASAVVYPFSADRPYLITFVLLAVTLLILESRRRRLLWFLPAILVVWANCHGGFILGWVVMSAYLADRLIRLFRKHWTKEDVHLCIACGLAFLASLLNPNGLHIIGVLLAYRKSSLTSRLLEWQPPSLWPPTILTVLLFATIVTLIIARRRVRVVDWLLFAAFTAAALSAGRNTFLIGLLLPVLLVTYLPSKQYSSVLIEMGAAVLVLAGACAVALNGGSFQLRVGDWAYPIGAADFLLSHHITGRMFNTYEYGGYLMWRLWPREKVFIDGRALSESVFQDYQRIVYNSADGGGKSASQLLDEFGVQVVVMNSFEYSSGLLYVLAPALSDPDTYGWSLVYADAQAMVFLRHPPENVTVLDSARVLPTIEAECELHIQHEPWFPGCARNLGQMFARTDDYPNARRWLGVYLAHRVTKDPEAEAEFQGLLGQ
ncbi:MAG TPA: hypothetical protein VHW09_21360 [Bryobacteraceae bacterium]|nr:hypothetical protein [Bryobacteraceae bacterium]